VNRNPTVTMNSTLGVLICAVMCVMTLTREASAQAYFRDDFDGDAFKPNWVLPPPERWNYEIGGGELTVNALKWPSQPFGDNAVFLNTPLPVFSGDYEITVGVRWDPWILPGGSARRFIIGTPIGILILEDNLPGLGSIGLQYDGKSINFIVPTDGNLDLGFRRIGTELSLLYQGQVLGSIPDTNGKSFNHLEMSFQVVYPWTMTPMHLDYIQVVPSPSTISLVVVGAAFGCFRRRP
jgi:hypothetical protein